MKDKKSLASLSRKPLAAHKKQLLAVIKVGGDILLNEEDCIGLSQNIADLISENWQVLLLHGGGPQADKLQKLHGLTPNKVGGRRITSKDDLLVIKQAICGEVNISLVQRLQDAGLNAFGCAGNAGKLITATHRPPRVVSGAGDKAINFGEVGDVKEVNTQLINHLLAADLIPVIATLGVDANSGRIFNINADTAVVTLAEAMQADLLLLTTSIGGVFEDIDDPESRIESIDESKAKELIESGVIQDGMIPKIEEALSVSSKVAIIGPREDGAFVSVACGNTDFGTTIV